MITVKEESKSLALGTIQVFTLTNAQGAEVRLSSYGAGVLAITVPDRDGKMADVVLGYKDLNDYDHDGPCAGKTPGRYANRIGLGKFTLDGVDYQMEINNGPNHLHGGTDNFSCQIWQGKKIDGGVEFSRISPSGEQNYPGTLTAKVTYTWSEDNVLTITYDADTDAPTVVNLTNHTYFNLCGDGSGNVLSTKLHLHADHYLPTNDSLVPTGEIASVKGTPMDFTTTKALNHNFDLTFPALKYGKGYDASWVINGWEKGKMSPVAEVMDEGSGRVLEISSTQPAVQVYTGNWLEGCPLGKTGKEYHDYDAVALECQGMPDAPNKANFPSQVLRPEGHYHEVICFAFKVAK